MLAGSGAIFIRTQGMDSNTLRGQNLIFPACIAGFELTFDDQTAEAVCLLDGKRQITGSAITQSSATMNLTFEFVDFNTLGFAYDELPSNSTAVPLPVLKSATIPATGPYTVSDADITVGTVNSVLVYNATKKVYMKKVATTPAIGEFSVAAGAITFNAGDSGNTVQYQVLKTYSSIETIGVENNADNFGVIEFLGQLYQSDNERYLLHVGKLTRSGSPSISITGGLATLQISFKAAVPPGWKKSFRLYNLSKATTT